jgi:4-amino-4-deoxy-L-arabinose transferase-like glycosyltransferase
MNPLNSLLIRVKTALSNKWRLGFILFAVIYLVLLYIGTPTELLRWDETVQLSGGMFLSQGNLNQFVSFNSFYPPMFDVFTAAFFKIFGVSLFSGRMVSMVFSIITLWITFEFVNRMYGPKVGLLSSVLLGLMPGFFWLSRQALIEITLIFFFSLTLLSFFYWLKSHQNKFLLISGLSLALGFFTKYQAIIAVAVMIFTLLIIGRNQIKKLFTKFPLLIIAIVTISAVVIFFTFQSYLTGVINQWIYALQIGNPQKSVYSTGVDHFPSWYAALPSWIQYPIFYFIETTWTYPDFHPVSPILFLVSLAGLAFFAWRRKPEDKFLLVWFLVVFVFFTLVPNKQWRYVMPMYPALAISAAALIAFAYTKIGVSAKIMLHSDKKALAKVAAVLLSVFLIVAGAYSVYNVYERTKLEQARIEIQQATDYAAKGLQDNESIVVLCAQNLFSQDMVRFYLWADGTHHNEVWQYPANPVDAYTINFNVTEFVNLCQQHNTKYVFGYEYGTEHYYNSTITFMDVYVMLADSGKFSQYSPQTSFGVDPRSIFVLEYLG